MSNLRVICIEKDATWEGTCTDGFAPKFGEICDVIGAEVDNEGVWFQIAKYLPHVFQQSGFAPLSQIDETEMTRENNLEIVK